MAQVHTLPKHIRPIHYDIRLEPDLDTCRIQGEARIEVEFLEDTEVIILNSVDIAVHDVVLTHGPTAQVAKIIE